MTRWTDADYESFGEEPPAQRSGRSSRSGGTLFDRAASDAAGGAAASAASRRAADAGYDGSGVGDADDDRAYDYGYDEAEPAYAGPTSPDPTTGTYPGAETVADAVWTYAEPYPAVAEIAAEFRDAGALVITEYRGLSMKQISQLR